MSTQPAHIADDVKETPMEMEKAGVEDFHRDGESHVSRAVAAGIAANVEDFYVSSPHQRKLHAHDRLGIGHRGQRGQRCRTSHGGHQSLEDVSQSHCLVICPVFCNHHGRVSS